MRHTARQHGAIQ